jgi:hypothetical protein
MQSSGLVVRGHRGRGFHLRLIACLGALALAACGDESAESLDEPQALTDNAAPTLSGTPATAVPAGTAYSFRPSAADTDGDRLTFDAVNVPQWASFDTATGELSGTPADADIGVTGDIEIAVSDGQARTAMTPFHVTITEPPAPDPGPSPAPSPPPPSSNSAPTISGTPPTHVVAGKAYTFRPNAADPNGDTLSFAVSNKPGWASFSTRTGQLNGTPANKNVGVFDNIQIRVSDGRENASLPTFGIQVEPPPNRAPTLSGSPATTATVGKAYGFQPSASDPDGNTLSFSIQNKPAWATFSIANGSLSGTPAASHTGTATGIVISVSDGKLSVSLPAFSISVTAAPNTAPRISGTPASSVSVGTAYDFVPTATDDEGDTLTFSIQGKPSWATFSTESGRLSGTPSAGDTGSYSNIVISVSDGKVSASLATFSITVNQLSTGSATVRWTAPTENTDGTALTNLAGFRIYFGTSSNSLTQTVQVANPAVMTHTIGNLSPATWYFSVTAYSTNGAESTRTGVQSKTID